MADYQGDSAWDEDNEEEEDDQKQRPESLKEKLIFMIDAQDNMFEPIELCGEPTTSFEAAQRTVVELLKLKAIQQPDDQVAVVLYNTREKDQPGADSTTGSSSGSSAPFVASFEGVRTLLELQQPSAEAVRAVRDMTGGWVLGPGTWDLGQARAV
ncbi:hypothetical protein PLESTM_001002700 [Pleodorina starrii]|nr:hypothetical protein PLESTM_001002700 [Pleodorina starrii]